MFGDLPVLIMLLISRRSCEQKENNILLCASKVNHFYSLNHFQNRNVKCIQPRLYPNTQNFLRRSCENKNTISTHLWRTWVEVVAEPSSVRGRGFCVVWWNGDGRAVGQLITARRCFPLSRVWRQRRGVSLDKKWFPIFTEFLVLWRQLRKKKKCSLTNEVWANCLAKCCIFVV